MKKFLYMVTLFLLLVSSYFAYDAYMFANYEVPGGCYPSNWRGQIFNQWLSYAILINFLILISMLVYKFLIKKKNQRLHFLILTFTGLLILLGVSFIFVKPLLGGATLSVCTDKGSY